MNTKQKLGIYAGAVFVLPLLIGAGSAFASSTKDAGVPFARGGNFSEEHQEIHDQVRALRMSGNIEQADALMAEAGLPIGARQGRRMNRRAHREEMKQALESGDYQAFREVAEGRPLLSDMTEADFEKMVLMHQYRIDGDTESADAIRDELGLAQSKRGLGLGR
jgi:hypothetical protein